MKFCYTLTFLPLKCHGHPRKTIFFFSEKSENKNKQKVLRKKKKLQKTPKKPNKVIRRNLLYRFIE